MPSRTTSPITWQGGYGRAVSVATSVPVDALRKAREDRALLGASQQRRDRDEREAGADTLSGRGRSAAVCWSPNHQHLRRDRPLHQRPGLRRHHDQSGSVRRRRYAHTRHGRRILVPALRKDGPDGYSRADPLRFVQGPVGHVLQLFHHHGDALHHLDGCFTNLRPVPWTEDHRLAWRRRRSVSGGALSRLLWTSPGVIWRIRPATQEVLFRYRAVQP